MPPTDFFSKNNRHTKQIELNKDISIVAHQERTTLCLCCGFLFVEFYYFKQVKEIHSHALWFYNYKNTTYLCERICRYKFINMHMYADILPPLTHTHKFINAKIQVVHLKFATKAFFFMRLTLHGFSVFTPHNGHYIYIFFLFCKKQQQNNNNE